MKSNANDVRYSYPKLFKLYSLFFNSILIKKLSNKFEIGRYYSESSVYTQKLVFNARSTYYKLIFTRKSALNEATTLSSPSLFIRIRRCFELS